VSSELRPPTEDDVATVARLMSAHSPEPVDHETILRSWTSPDVEVERDARIEVGGYTIVEDLGDGRAWIDLSGDPSPALLDWAEARASEIAPRLFSGAWSEEESVLRALEKRRFRLIRHSHRMEIDLREPTPAPEWPVGIEARTFREGDERTFYDVYHESFEDSWEPIDTPYDKWSHWLLEGPSFAPDLWFLAHEKEEPAGIAICHPHQTVEDLGWVRILGVRRPWRRRGLGRALLLQAFAAFRDRGLARAGLGVDAESVTGANRLYDEAGMHVRTRFDIYEKVVT
jgi:mycothiol synthase